MASWLPQLAVNYSEYRFNQLVFIYKPRVNSNASVNTDIASGTVIMCSEYNPDEFAPVTKADAMAKLGSVAGSASGSHDLIHGVECDPSKNAGPAGKYVRPFANDGDITEGSQVRYDKGRTFVCVADTPTSWEDAAIGELYVQYEVELSKPRLQSALGRSILTDRFMIDNTGTPPTWAHSDWFGTDGNYQSANTNTIGGILGRWGTNDIGVRYYFPDEASGYFQLRLTVRCTATTNAQDDPTTYGTSTGGNIEIIEDANDLDGGTAMALTCEHAGSTFAAGQVFIMTYTKNMLVRKAVAQGANQWHFTPHPSSLNCFVNQWTIEVYKYQSTGDPLEYELVHSHV
jgi:hypothetical protein